MTLKSFFFRLALLKVCKMAQKKAENYYLTVFSRFQGGATVAYKGPKHYRPI